LGYDFSLPRTTDSPKWPPEEELGEAPAPIDGVPDGAQLYGGTLYPDVLFVSGSEQDSLSNSDRVHGSVTAYQVDGTLPQTTAYDTITLRLTYTCPVGLEETHTDDGSDLSVQATIVSSDGAEHTVVSVLTVETVGGVVTHEVSGSEAVVGAEPQVVEFAVAGIALTQYVGRIVLFEAGVPVAETTFSVARPCDLVVVDKGEQWLPGQERIAYTVSFTIQNVGEATVPAGHDVGLTVDGVDMGEQIEVPVSLAAGETFSGEFAWVIPITDGADQITVCADFNAEITETEDGNNCLSNEFAVPPTIPIEVDLVDGWNITALAAEPETGHAASTLAADINAQGGQVTQVFWWNAPAGTWDFWLVDVEYGTDFVIELGHGYLLMNTAATTWTYEGLPLPAGPGQVSLVDGWNLIALPVRLAAAYTASAMAAEINGQGAAVDQVFWWNAPAGTWDFWLVDIQYGTDFAIELGEGYLVKNGNAATWVIPGN